MNAAALEITSESQADFVPTGVEISENSTIRRAESKGMISLKIKFLFACLCVTFIQCFPQFAK